jgi:hypothetical protein
VSAYVVVKVAGLSTLRKSSTLSSAIWSAVSRSPAKSAVQARLKRVHPRE